MKKSIFILMMLLIGSGCNKQISPAPVRQPFVSSHNSATETPQENIPEPIDIKDSSAITNKPIPLIRDEIQPYHQEKNEYGSGEKFGTVIILGYTKIIKDIPECA